MMHLPTLAEGRTFTHRRAALEVEEGAQVACRVDGGRLRVTRIDESDLDADAAERAAQHLRTTYDALDGANSAGGPIDERALLLETVVRAPTAFRIPVPPITDQLAMTGLDEDLKDWVRPVDDDEIATARFEEFYGLDDMGAQAVGILIGAMDLFDREEREELPDGTAEHLLQMLELDPAVVEALLDSRLGSIGSGVAGAPRSTGPSRSTRTCTLPTRTWPGTSRIVATQPQRCATCAWPVYVTTTSRSNGPSSARPPAATSAATIRPCRSAAKYKRCCERTGGPLPDRIDGIFDKIGMHLSRPLQRTELMPLVEARAGDASDQQRLVAAISDPVVFGVAVFEDEWLEDFLEERGSLLPADERELVGSWVGAPGRCTTSSRWHQARASTCSTCGPGTGSRCGNGPAATS